MSSFPQGYGQRLARRLLAILLGLFATGCGGPAPSAAPPATSPPPTPSPAGPRIVLVTEPGSPLRGDASAAAAAGVRQAAAALGGEVTIVVPHGYAELPADLDAAALATVVVTVGYQAGPPTAEAARRHPGVPFLGVDQAVCLDLAGLPDPTFTCPGDPARLLPNYHGLTFAEAEAGYLAGVAAASVSRSGILGVVGGSTIPSVVRYWRGFQNGARSVNASVQVRYREVDPDPAMGFADPAGGAAAARLLVAGGADVIFDLGAFGLATATSRGVLDVVCAAGAAAVGADVDQAGADPIHAACLLASATKAITAVVKAAVEAALAGDLPPGTIQYGASSRPAGIGLTPAGGLSDRLTAAVQRRLQQAFAGLAGGRTDPCRPVACTVSGS